MLTGKKIVLFGAGIIGRRALEFFGADRVFCFADNHKTGQVFCDKTIISFEKLAEIANDYDVVLSVNAGSTQKLIEQCDGGGVCYTIFSDLVSHEDYASDTDIRQFENKHKGERCFLIGNGPSLSSDDLTKLHERNEISFGCNAICKIFHQTPWRPKYYALMDPSYFADKKLLSSIEAKYKFFPESCGLYPGVPSDLMDMLLQGKGKSFFCRLIPISKVDKLPEFSTDASRALYAGATVMYAMMQIAVYMGFSKLILIGVDGGTVVPDNPKEYVIEKHHFFDEDEQWIKTYNSIHIPTGSEIAKQSVTNEYLKAETHTRERGIKILNATRGGVIDVFERMDFDSLF